VSVCRGCGARVVWGKTPEGKTIPLDPKPPIYVVENVVQDPADATNLKVTVSRANGTEIVPGVRRFMVSHFATCPEAGTFTGRTAKPEEPKS